MTFEDIENSEGGVEAYLAGIAGELHAKTYKASPVRRQYIDKANGKVNHYVLRRMARWLNRRSQRRHRLRYASTCYGELQHMGLLRLRWMDYRR